MNLIASLVERSLRRVILFVERHPWFTAFVLVAFIVIKSILSFGAKLRFAGLLAGVLQRVYVTVQNVASRLPRPALYVVDLIAILVAPVPFLLYWLLMDVAREGYVFGGSNFSVSSAEKSSPAESPGGSLPNETEPERSDDPFAFPF